jgi:hypothetical protein
MHPMSKLRLQIEDLRIDSFDTLGEAGRRLDGTVYGRADVNPIPISRTQDPVACTYQTGPTCPECPHTYYDTCRTCRGDSCDICIDPTRETD